MSKSILKSTGASLYYAPLLALLSIASSHAAESSRADLLAQLITRLGAEKAADFMRRLEQKHYVAPIASPAPITEPAKDKPFSLSAPIVQPENPVVQTAPPAPIKRVGLDIALEDLHHFDQILLKLEGYSDKVYHCVDSFFNKRNFDPYRTHVQCFKNQLQYIREELLHQYPQPQTPDAAKLFRSLQIIAEALEKSQESTCETLDADFGTGMFSGTKLGMAMNSMSSLINTQKRIIDKEIGILRNQLRTAKEPEMLKKVNNLYTLINKNFDYGNNKKVDELLSILNHRVKR